MPTPKPNPLRAKQLRKPTAPKAKGKGKDIHSPKSEDALKAFKSRTSHAKLVAGKMKQKPAKTTKFKHKTGDVHIHDDAVDLYKNMHSHPDFKRELDNHISKIASVNKHPGKSPEQKLREKQAHSGNLIKRIGHLINNHPQGHKIFEVDGEEIDFGSMSPEERKAFIRQNFSKAMKNAALLGLSLFDQGAGSVISEHMQTNDDRNDRRQPARPSSGHQDDAIELAKKMREQQQR